MQAGHGRDSCGSFAVCAPCSTCVVVASVVGEIWVVIGGAARGRGGCCWLDRSYVRRRISCG